MGLLSAASKDVCTDEVEFDDAVCLEFNTFVNLVLDAVEVFEHVFLACDSGGHLSLHDV